MELTKNYKLKKPGPDDYVVIGDFNYNVDEIDAILKNMADKLSKLNLDFSEYENIEQLLNRKADLGEDGKVLKEQLPKLDIYEDILMFDNQTKFPVMGDQAKLYIDKATNKIYRWDTKYIEVSKSLDIGIITGSAFDGKRGYDLENKVGKMYTNVQVDKLIEESKSASLEQIMAFS